MKRTVFAAFGLLASLTVAVPAYAAESLDCIRQNVAPAVLSTYEDKIVAGLVANDQNALNQDWSTLRPAFETCRAKYKWSDTAASIASQLTLTTIMKGAVERTLIKDGMNPVLLASMYRDLPLDVRRQFLDQATIQAASLVFAQRMIDRKMVTGDNVNNHVGMLLAALALLEFRPAEFAAA